MASASIENGFTFAFITDTHVCAGASISGPENSWEVDSSQTLRQVVTALNELESRPAFVVIGGDLVSPDLVVKDRPLTEADYESSYALLSEIVSELKCPVHMLLGNHDNRGAFHRMMQTGSAPNEPHDFSFDFNGCHFVALDSLHPGEPGGRLAVNQLDWLSQDLAAHPNAPTVVFVHHHPVRSGNDWLDTMPLHNGDELLNILGNYSQVRQVLCGHVHMEFQAGSGSATVYASPSTCFQISPTFNGRRLLSGPPAFRLATVDDQGFSTRVVYLHSTGV